MPAKFKPGDVVSLAGQEWTISSWPETDRGNFTYYRDENGVRTWGLGWTGKTPKGEPVAQESIPVFVREGTLEDHQDTIGPDDE